MEQAENRSIMVKRTEKIPICITGITYFVSSSFLDDARAADIYWGRLSETSNAKKAIARVIYEEIKTNEAFSHSLEEIEQLDDCVYTQFIESIVKADVDVMKHYNKQNVELPSTERFAIAYSAYWEKLRKNLSVTMKKLVEKIESLKLPDILPGASYLIQQFQETTASFYSSLGDTLRNATQFNEQFANSIHNTLSNLSIVTTDYFAGIKIPGFSEERKQELLAAYKKWGEFGWTELPQAPTNFFSWCPDDVSAADKIALTHCNPEHLQKLFGLLRVQKIKKKDLEDAVFCYEHRQYKACALIIFGIIDAKLIREQKKNEWRKVGSKAIDKYKEKIEATSNIHNTLFLLLHYVNMTACLEALFSSGGNFKNEPKIINRNFIGHGMNLRNVRKKDCIQLFLTLYNFMELWEIMKAGA